MGHVQRLGVTIGMASIRPERSWQFGGGGGRLARAVDRASSPQPTTATPCAGPALEPAIQRCAKTRTSMG